MTNKKLHWFLISYKAFYEDAEGYTEGHFVASNETKNISESSITDMLNTIKEIVKNDSNNIVKTSIITSISYLGYMTQDEFYDE